MEPTKTPRVLSGRYELSHLVARGGMAEVYRAHDQLLDRPVALKVLFPELSVDRSFVERFRREAQAAANLSDPHIVPVFDWGEDGGTYFIVMEFVDGRALSSILRTAGPLHPDRAAEIASDVALALSYAHRHGVVHRDVKPGNVLITEEGTIKVTDFGIARAVNTEESLTQTGAVMGTATYFSPEQAEGMGVDARSDIYSLGVVLFEMVTGRPPFLGDTPVAVASKHVREHPPRPRDINPGVPPDLEAIILKCLAKDPDHRYATGEDLAKDLQYFREGRAVRAAAPTTGQHPVVGATQAVGAVSGRTQTLAAVGAADGFAPEEPPSRTRVYAAILAVLLVALAVVIVFLGNSLGWWHVGTATTTVTVPNVANQSVTQAETTLKGKGLHVRTVPDPSATTIQKTQVIRTEPAAGTTVDKGQTVTVVTGNQGPPVHVPYLVTQSMQAAEAQLKALGLAYKVTTSKTCSSPLIVCAQSPTGGTLPPGGTVVLTSAPSTAAVPNVVGLDETTACANIGQAGFQCGSVTKQPSQLPSGSVVTTNPAAGAQEAPGTAINLVVSSGPSQVVVPDVMGKTSSAAITALSGVNLVPVEICQSTQNAADDGVVLAQNPTGGVQVTPSTPVQITVGSLSGCGSTSTTTTTSSASGNTGGGGGGGNATNGG